MMHPYESEIETCNTFLKDLSCPIIKIMNVKQWFNPCCDYVSKDIKAPNDCPGDGMNDTTIFSFECVENCSAFNRN